MIKVTLKFGKTAKTYLRNIPRSAFNSLMYLLNDLFSNNNIETTEAEDQIYELIKSSGYLSVSDISPDEKEKLENYYHHLQMIEKEKFDQETVIYLLLSAIKKGRIFMVIDGKLVTDVKKKIILDSHSVIAFFDRNKMDAIEFKTL